MKHPLIFCVAVFALSFATSISIFLLTPAGAESPTRIEKRTVYLGGSGSVATCFIVSNESGSSISCVK